MRRTAFRLLFAAAAVAFAACGRAGSPGIETPSSAPNAVHVVEVGGATSASPAIALSGAPIDPGPSAPPPASSASTGPPLRFGCMLPAPLASKDACAADADCGVSEPCHAPACVGKAHSHPPSPTTTCTRNLVCSSADANRCGCFEGRCALIPR